MGLGLGVHDGCAAGVNAEGKGGDGGAAAGFHEANGEVEPVEGGAKRGRISFPQRYRCTPFDAFDPFNNPFIESA